MYLYYDVMQSGWMDDGKLEVKWAWKRGQGQDRTGVQWTLYCGEHGGTEERRMLGTGEGKGIIR